jgi:hypothetical protein
VLGRCRRAAVRLRVRGCAEHAVRGRPAADHPRRDQVPFDVQADATATGTVARPDATALTGGRSTARLLVSALPRARHCPRSTPTADTPHTDTYDLYETRFTEVLDIPDATEVARQLRLCGYLTAERRTPSGVRTVTVARASTTLTAPAPQNSSEEPSWGVRVIAWIISVTLFIGLVIGFIVGLIRLVRWWIHDIPAARGARRAATLRRLRLRSAAPPPAPPVPSYAVPASPPPQSAQLAAPIRQPAPVRTERPRRRAKPRDVVLDAVDAIADVYRIPLQIRLEERDGSTWLDALNHRRHVSMTGDGKSPPRPYEFLEPRAVLNCLAYDPAGRHLIPEAATTKARQLSGLVNEAHHPRPHAPLTEADGYRAWRLYTDITGHVPVGDPFER